MASKLRRTTGIAAALSVTIVLHKGPRPGDCDCAGKVQLSAPSRGRCWRLLGDLTRTRLSSAEVLNQELMAACGI
jgi:hypothetical protein